VIQNGGMDADVSDEVARDVARRRGLRGTNALVDRAAALECARLAELGELRGPCLRAIAGLGDAVVVHQ
jgi:hypothetical protein